MRVEKDFGTSELYDIYIWLVRREIQDMGINNRLAYKVWHIYFLRTYDGLLNDYEDA